MSHTKKFDEQLLHRFDKIDKESLRPFVCDLITENSVLRECLNNLVEGVAIAKSNGDFYYLNESASKWLGIHVSSKGKQATISAVEDTRLKEFLQKALTSKNEKVVDDIQILSPMETFLRLHVFSLSASISDQKVIIMENRTQDIAEQLDTARISRIESLVSLAAGVAHEIGNPLNSLSIHLQMLGKTAADLPKSKRQGFKNSLDILISETKRLDNIVKNFLKATRKPPLRFRSENINSILEDVLQFLMPELKDNQIRTALKKDEKLPFFLLDRDRLYQAFVNLVKNAMESMPHKGKLDIKVSHAKKVAMIEFKDQGKGIDEKQLPHIFDVYYTTKEEGAGLGMMAVYDAVTEHGGRIDVASKPNKGTTFTLLIPIRQPKLQLPSYEINKE